MNGVAQTNASLNEGGDALISCCRSPSLTANLADLVRRAGTVYANVSIKVFEACMGVRSLEPDKEQQAEFVRDECEKRLKAYGA